MCEKNVLLRSLREPNIEAGPEKTWKDVVDVNVLYQKPSDFVDRKRMEMIRRNWSDSSNGSDAINWLRIVLI